MAVAEVESTSDSDNAHGRWWTCSTGEGLRGDSESRRPDWLLGQMTAKFFSEISVPGEPSPRDVQPESGPMTIHKNCIR